MVKRHSLWPWLLVTVAALPIVLPFVTAPPLSHDHPVRIFQAWNFWTEMLGRGRLRGWSQMYGFGYPAGELYPFGPEAWVASFRLLTLGKLSWLQTYGVALAAALIFAALGTLSFARRQFGTGAAVVAAILSTIDPGGWAEGGWFWHTTFGVWPVTLAMGFVLFSLSKLSDILEYERRRDVIYAGLLIAISLLMHLLPLTVYPIAVPLLMLDRKLRTGSLSWSSVRRALTACALGIGLAAFSVLPMMSRTALTLDLGVQGVSREELGNAIANVSLFGGMWPPIFVLGAVGALLAVWPARQFRPFVPLVTLLAILLSSNLLVKELHLERVISGLIKVEAHRFVLVAKLFWFPLVGHAVSVISRQTFLTKVGDRQIRIGRRITVALLFVGLLPVAWPALTHLYRTQFEKQYQTPRQTEYWADLQKFLAWSARERHTHSGEFYRVAYALPMHDHLSGIAPMLDPGPMYKIGYTPAQIFNRFPMSDEAPLLEALSVKYLVSNQRHAEPEFTPVTTFGALSVYRFNQFRSDPFTLFGEGHASLKSFEPESIRLEVTGVRAPTRLRLHVASFPCWRATLNGVELPITTVAVHDAEYPMLMEVPVTNGQLEFRYVRRAIDWLGLAITLLSIALLAATLVLGFKKNWAAPLRNFASALAAPLRALERRLRSSKAPRWLPWALVGVVLLAALAVLFVRARPPLPSDSLFRSSLPIDVSLGGAPCQKDGFAAWKCGSERVEPAVRSGLYGAHLCMNAPANGPLVVSATLKAPSFVAGRYDVAGGSGAIRVSFADQPIGQLSTRDPSQGLQFFQFDTRADAGKLVKLNVTLEGAPLHCFDLTLVP